MEQVRESVVCCVGWWVVRVFVYFIGLIVEVWFLVECLFVVVCCLFVEDDMFGCVEVFCIGCVDQIGYLGSVEVVIVEYWYVVIIVVIGEVYYQFGV